MEESFSVNNSYFDLDSAKLSLFKVLDSASYKTEECDVLTCAPKKSAELKDAILILACKQMSKSEYTEFTIRLAIFVYCSITSSLKPRNRMIHDEECWLYMNPTIEGFQ